jgi:hypothetical protein
MVAMAVGLFCMVIGAREGIFRFVAVPLGVIMGVTLTAPVLELTRGTPLSPTLVELGLPAVLGLLSGIYPQTIAFATLGSVGAAVGVTVVAEHELLIGALPGFFLAGVVGIVFSRIVDTLAAAAFGALLLVGGTLAAFSKVALVQAVAGNTWAPAICWALLTASGAALQMVLFDDSEARAEARAKAKDERQRAKDDKAREQKFAKYGKRAG